MSSFLHSPAHKNHIIATIHKSIHCSQSSKKLPEAVLPLIFRRYLFALLWQPVYCWCWSGFVFPQSAWTRCWDSKSFWRGHGCNHKPVHYSLYHIENNEGICKHCRLEYAKETFITTGKSCQLICNHRSQLICNHPLFSWNFMHIVNIGMHESW